MFVGRTGSILPSQTAVPRWRLRWGVMVLAALLIGNLPMGVCRADENGAAATARHSAEALEFFEREVRPLLVKRCHSCHGAKKQQAGLRLDSLTAILKGGDSGAAVVPNKPTESLLLSAVRYETFEMPPTGKLPQQEIATLERWIAMGTPWPQETTELATRANGGNQFPWKERLAHWSFQPLKNVSRPAVQRSDWAADPLDEFVLAKLESLQLTPAPDADGRSWLRRVYFDLIGLPPSVPEVEEFLARPDRQAREAVVDRLLQSPQFGERWARHWMDLVRYADSRGHEFDYTAANAYQYRDYLIRAFNADVPYNQLVMEHLAGDLIDTPRLHPEQGWNESILGTGFWFLGEWVHSPVDVRQDEAERFDNMIDTMSKTFLGLTVSCARCHDHKFDAISTQDYHALYGYLQSSTYRQVRFETLEQDRAVAEGLATFRRDHADQVRRGWAVALDRGIQPVDAGSFANYLLAAQAVLQLAPEYRPLLEQPPAADKQPAVAPQTLTLSMQHLVQQLAKERQLDPVRLAHWCRYLWQPLTPSDPLKVWSDICAGEPQTLEPRLKRMAQNLTIPAALDLSALHVIVDYRNSTSTDWWQDGFAFGSEPVQSGGLEWGSSALVEGLAIDTAAQRDPAWQQLALAPGTERNPGDMGNFTIPGSTLHTKTFELSNPQLHYLVRGQGTAQVVVDSHRTLNGPLHRRTVLRMPDSPADGPRWIAHRLDDYVGHRVHVEFTPAPRGEFAVLAVTLGDNPPPLATPGVPDAVRSAMADVKQPADLRAVVLAYQAWAQQATLLLGESDQGAKRAQAEDQRAKLSMADWLIRHRDLVLDDSQQAALANQLRPLQQQYAQLVGSIERSSHTAMAMMDGSGENEHVFIRGNPHNLGPEVPRRLLTGIAGDNQPTPSHGSGRLEMARRVVDPANPFASRVIVNRLWHHLLGRGIVASVNNFGHLGEEPSHPLLLDFLATRFMDEGWSMKQMIRNIVLSRTYGQSSQNPDPQAAQRDPQNLLLHRARVRRLSGEAIRDSLLAVSGRLDRTMYGPNVPIYLTPFAEGRGRPRSGPLDGAGRRSVYLSVRRNFLSPMMLAFDMPIPFNSIGRRNVSNVPAQALILLNDPFVVEMARVWSERLLKEPASAEQRVRTLYLTALARPATAEELSSAIHFLKRQDTAHVGKSSGDANSYTAASWQDLCHVMFNLREFIFLD